MSFNNENADVSNMVDSDEDLDEKMERQERQISVITRKNAPPAGSSKRALQGINEVSLSIHLQCPIPHFCHHHMAVLSFHILISCKGERIIMSEW